jgi:hypothetical protein
MFSGFPAKYNLSKGPSYGLSYRADFEEPGEGDTWENYFRVSKSSDHNFSVKINETVLYISFYVYDEVQMSNFTPGNVDMRDNIDWNNIGVDTTLMENVKTLMNHVKIVKMQN